MKVNEPKSNVSQNPKSKYLPVAYKVNIRRY